MASAALVLSLAAAPAFAASGDYSGASQSHQAQQQAAPTPMSQKTSNIPASRTDVVAVASRNQNLTTLVRLLQESKLDQTLSKQGTFTLFAPTNAAFDKLSPNTLANLERPQNRDQLQRILNYHVVSGSKITADQVTGRSATPQTVQGQELMVNGAGSHIMVNNAATVTSTDIQASNGVIHIIDTVLMPEPMVATNPPGSNAARESTASSTDMMRSGAEGRGTEMSPAPGTQPSSGPSYQQDSNTPDRPNKLEQRSPAPPSGAE